MSDYIPDMTERFPEGMRGVDMTDNYFPNEGYMGDMRDTNPLINPQVYHEIEREHIGWDEMVAMAKSGKVVTAERLRLISDVGYPYIDISYFHVIIEGKHYSVLGGLYQLNKAKYRTELYSIVKREKIFIKDLFNAISYMM